MRAFGQKLVKFCTLTHAAKLVVRLSHIIATRHMIDSEITSNRCNHISLCNVR